MSRPPAHPGPHDGSRPLLAALTGAAIGLVLYIIKEYVASDAWPQNVFYWVIAGAVIGYLVALARKRRR